MINELLLQIFPVLYALKAYTLKKVYATPAKGWACIALCEDGGLVALTDNEGRTNTLPTSSAYYIRSYGDVVGYYYIPKEKCPFLRYSEKKYEHLPVPEKGELTTVPCDMWYECPLPPRYADKWHTNWGTAVKPLLSADQPFKTRKNAGGMLEHNWYYVFVP